ncbi:MAG: hypothetical protein JNN08_12585 [Bryobacterales bacterium]|nr:hypothetical protein [Bryobacterales bacterium]
MTTALRRLAFVSLLAVAGSYAVVHLRGPNGIPALFERREKIRALEEENRKLREANGWQRQRNRDLLQDEDLLRREIQKRQGKVPEGAVEFRVGETPPER